MVQFDNARRLADSLRPEEPVLLRRPHAVRRAASFFLDQFPGSIFYAVKANPDPWLIQQLWEAGVRCFDAASLAEVRHVRAALPNAAIAFMHPIKSERAIAEAYFEHGVRIFAVDSLRELTKLHTATGQADDLTICIRLQVASDLAKISLASKFGAREADEVALLQAARRLAKRLGVAFHVGSQAMSPAAFVGAMDRSARAVRRSGVFIDILDVGGGFPAHYPGMEPPALEAFFAEISDRWAEFPSAANAELWCEPGRALSAEAESLLVRVEDRRGDTLYINDGGFGALYDAANLDWRFPCANRSRDGAPLVEFDLFGPTCDDADAMRGPFLLPEDTQPGDYIEFGTVGAYGRSMVTQFNGYGTYQEADLTDDPFQSVYTGARVAFAEEAQS
ncbi:MAG: type III PLP-dependent enzyme [Pseudomonadota bacterium]